ncbi:MAG: DUF1566 domain-containing protein, partial [Thermodesulfobacteriota bacterium]|nr:DUF1566 domain-containing protein [Thermodesulfobacteriota bacterium]
MRKVILGILFLMLLTGGVAMAALVDNGDDTVTDTETGLMWQKETASGTYTWQQALAHAEGMTLGGHSDWRLPNRNELQTLVDYSRYNPSINPLLEANTVSSSYWSSTTSAYNASNAWLVRFSYGYVNAPSKSSSYYVRAVRAGQNRLLGHLVISVPAQATRWGGGSEQVITWNAQGIEGNVRISISRQGGKDGTFETIVESAENDGTYEWTVTGPRSFNCMLKIEPLSEPDKATTQGLFSICYDTELSGTVSDLLTGDPIENVTVSTNDDLTTQTNSQGDYSFTGSLSPGAYAITFSKTGYQTVTISDVEVRAGEPTELNVSLPISLSGTVTDLSTGTAISNVTVSTIDDQSTQTNTQGYYAFVSLTPNVYAITFSKTGYQTVTISDVVITAGESTKLNVELTPPGPLNILTTDFPPSESGGEYNPRVRITGGTYPYTYSIAGSLPPGLSLNTETGNITGTPTTPGSYTFSIGVTDAQGAYAEREFTIEVTEPLEIVSESPLSRGARGTSYFFSIEATGGTLPYVFTMTTTEPTEHEYELVRSSCTWSQAKANCESKGGYLVTISSAEENTIAGNLSQQAGNSAWIGFTDSSWEGHWRWVTGEPAVYTNWRSGEPNNSWGGEDCGEIISKSLPYTWNDNNCSRSQYYICEYDLPPGLPLDTDGHISGVPTFTGSYQFIITATDASGRTTEKTFHLEIVDPLILSTSKLNNGITGNPYNQPLSSSGGYGAHHWAVYSGTLPAGLSLNTETGDLSGT